MGILASSADERVKSVRSDDDALSVDLMDGRTIIVPLAWYPRLLHATQLQRDRWETAGGGYGIHWTEIDEDLSTEGLLRGAPRRGANLPLRSGNEIGHGEAVGQKTFMATRKTKDWRQTIGAFTDDEGMKEILREAIRLRELDRKKARSKTAVVDRSKSSKKRR